SYLTGLLFKIRLRTVVSSIAYKPVAPVLGKPRVASHYPTRDLPKLHGCGV
ncbi:MAG: hypothetical protein RL701_7853, partial [Pseudomonadota bacterium]